MPLWMGACLACSNPGFESQYCKQKMKSSGWVVPWILYNSRMNVYSLRWAVSLELTFPSEKCLSPQYFPVLWFWGFALKTWGAPGIWMLGAQKWFCFSGVIGKFLALTQTPPCWRLHSAIAFYHSEHPGKLTLNLKTSFKFWLFCCCWCLGFCFSLTTMSLFSLTTSGNSNPDSGLLQLTFLQLPCFSMEVELF